MRKAQESIAFIQDYYNTKEFIPLHVPKFSGNERKYTLETIDSTFVSSVGAFVNKFEEMMQVVSQTSKAVAVVNGTSGLQVALKLAGVKPGDEVLTQALTFVATANAINYNAAHPVFLDVDLDTMGLSPKAVEAFLNKYGEVRGNSCYNKKTGNRITACLPMHTFGFPLRIVELVDLCDKWKITVVEDAAESLGSKVGGVSTGGFGKLGVFSFNGNKIVTCGGGGAIVSNDLKIGERAKFLTTTAKKEHPYEYYHQEVGYNFRMPNLNAALACAQLENLEKFVEEKRALAVKYDIFFKELNLNFRKELPGTRANYWLMCVELKDKEERDQFLKVTNEANVMTRPIWQLMYRLPMYKDSMRDEQKNAEFLEQRIVNVPSSVR